MKSVMDLPCSWSNGKVSSSGLSMAPILSGLQPPGGNFNPFLNSSKHNSLKSPGEKLLSTPSPAIEMSKHQDYPSPQPIPDGKPGKIFAFIDISK